MEEVTSRTPSQPPRFAVRPRDAWFLGIGLLVVALDQLTKWIIRQSVVRGEAWPDTDWPFRIVHYRNTGAAFGMLQNAGPLLVVTSLIGMTAILIYLFNPGFARPLMRVGLALMLGGAVGNLIDRLVNGNVVDFIQVPHWPAFNVADSAISIGVVILLWEMLRESSKETGASS